MKTMEDYEQEGYRAQTWYLASCPYIRSDIRDAWQRGAWKWQEEQRKKRIGAYPLPQRKDNAKSILP